MVEKLLTNWMSICLYAFLRVSERNDLFTVVSGQPSSFGPCCQRPPGLLLHLSCLRVAPVKGTSVITDGVFAGLCGGVSLHAVQGHQAPGG